MKCGQQKPDKVSTFSFYLKEVKFHCAISSYVIKTPFTNMPFTELKFSIA